MLRDTPFRGWKRRGPSWELRSRPPCSRGRGQCASCTAPACRGSQNVTYPVDRFREVYGDAATLEVSQVVNKRVRELVEAGDLDGQHLEATLPSGRASRAVSAGKDAMGAELGWHARKRQGHSGEYWGDDSPGILYSSTCPRPARPRFQ